MWGAGEVAGGERSTRNGLVDMRLDVFRLAVVYARLCVSREEFRKETCAEQILGWRRFHGWEERRGYIWGTTPQKRGLAIDGQRGA